jgi:uncharacterized protein with NRDE domain
MCLLVVVSRLDPGAPLVVGANRDERLERPATAMTVLRDAGPRVVGGRDEVAGGTWLAVNEHGVVAGLTNRPSPEGPLPARRSRGELPLALAEHRDAASAVEEFVTRFRPSRYNPAWLLVGDRTSLYALDMTGGDGDVVTVEALGPGVHILENNPRHAHSPKETHVRALLGNVATLEGEALTGRMHAVLVDHSVPDTAAVSNSGSAPVSTTAPVPAEGAAGGPAGPVPAPRPRPAATLAACVHTEDYGTRSSTIVSVPAVAASLPRVLVADGHPCTSAFVDMSGLFGP